MQIRKTTEEMELICPPDFTKSQTQPLHKLLYSVWIEGISDLWNQLRNVPNHYCFDRKRPDGWHNTSHCLKLQQGENHQVLKQPSWIVLLQALSLEEKLYHLP